MRLSVLICGLALAGPAAAHNYPTPDRVEFVLECMKNNGGEYAYLYKCSCAIDEIAKQMPYEQYVDASTVARYTGMGGERMGAFRDPEPMKNLNKLYRGVSAEARKSCGVPR